MPTTSPFQPVHIELPFTMWDVIKSAASWFWFMVKLMPWWLWVLVAIAALVRLADLATHRR